MSDEPAGELFDGFRKRHMLGMPFNTDEALPAWPCPECGLLGGTHLGTCNWPASS